VDTDVALDDAQTVQDELFINHTAKAISLKLNESQSGLNVNFESVSALQIGNKWYTAEPLLQGEVEKFNDSCL